MDCCRAKYLQMFRWMTVGSTHKPLACVAFNCAVPTHLRCQWLFKFMTIGALLTNYFLMIENSCKYFPKSWFIIFTAPIRRMGKVMFFSLFTTGGVSQIQVLSLISGPRSFPGGTPVQDSFPGFWSQVLSRGYSSPRWGGGVCPTIKNPQCAHFLKVQSTPISG